MSELKDLHAAFYETLKDVNFATQHSVKAARKSASHTQSPELRKNCEAGATLSEQQVKRLEEVFKTINEKPSAKECKAMSGIIAEMDEDLEDFARTPAGDAVIIGCAQAIMHYKIARYGMLAAWARQLNNKQGEKLLTETLREVETADKELSSMAEKVNLQGIKQAA